jgi:hypothetical protein
MKKFTKQMLVAVAIVLGTTNAARADSKDCDLATLRGLYLFSASGFNIVATGEHIPKVIGEFIRFNGDGTLTSPGGTVIIGGVKLPPSPPGIGTYTLGENCIGTLSFTPQLTFDIFVFPKGDELVMVQTAQPVALGLPVMQGTVVRVSK